MHFRVKGKFRIGGALVLGILIVLGAFFVGDKNTTYGTNVGTVTKAPERSAITTTDSDKDGVPDWEESLQAKVFETIDTPTSTILVSDEPYEPPTTFTGKFSEAFFKDYLQGKINGEDFSDPTAFVGTAIQAIEQNTASKQHAIAELTIVPDSEESIRTYGNRVAEIIQSNSIGNENEALILQRALQANDPEMLKALEPINAVYTKMIEESLQMPVPQSLAFRHVDLLNAYEAILTDIGAMQVAFTDPLFSLARVKAYQKDAEALYTALKGIADFLSLRDVIFMSEEPGSFFDIFAS